MNKEQRRKREKKHCYSPICVSQCVYAMYVHLDAYVQYKVYLDNKCCNVLFRALCMRSTAMTTSLISYFQFIIKSLGKLLLWLWLSVVATSVVAVVIFILIIFEMKT